MNRPVVNDDFFGALEFDELARSYRGKLEFAPSHRITVIIESMGIAPAEAIAKSREIYNTVTAREPEYRLAVATELLPLYNRSSSESKPLDTESFVRRISLESIIIAPIDLGKSDCANLYYWDGGLLAGHIIEVFLNTDFSYNKAHVAG
jgi:hypothetical protein